MTSRYLPNGSPPPTWQILRAPGRPAGHTEAGRIAVPLIVRASGGPPLDGLLVLTAEQAEELTEELRELLYPRSEGQAS